MAKPRLCLDFDGVIHRYNSGWLGPAVIPDDPVPGAFQFILDAQRLFTVAIFSGRSQYPEGRAAMQLWFRKHAQAGGYAPTDFELEWPDNKPGAHMYVDDRGFRFNGHWPTPEELAAMQPWHLEVRS